MNLKVSRITQQGYCDVCKVSPRRVHPEFRCDALQWYMEKFFNVVLSTFHRF